MKKWITLCLVAAIVVMCFIDCGGEDRDKTSESSVPVATFGGEGTTAVPYEIATAEDLWAMAALVNTEDKSYRDAHYIQTADIDLDGEPWTPIGDGYLDSFKSFCGSFDGNGHTIKGLNVACKENDKVRYFGLFGLMSPGAVVKNVTIASSTIDCTSKSGSNTGVIVGRMEYNTMIENCHIASDVTVKGSYTTGGLVAEMCGTMTGCTNAATVIGTSEVGRVGGLIGQISSYKEHDLATVTDCSNSGTVQGAGVAGGVIGMQMSGITDNCANTAPVSGESAGGIVGCVNGAQTNGTVSEYIISNSSNSGKITAGDNGGGIAGVSQITTGNVSISGCSNVGAVLGKHMGGILGYCSTSTDSGMLMLSDCSNEGPLEMPEADGTHEAGGIVAAVTASHGGTFVITDCMNTADINGGTGVVGGILGSYLSTMGEGYSAELTLENCANEGAVTGGPMGVGGVIGSANTRDYPTMTMLVSNCSNSGALFAHTACVRMGGIVGAIEPHHCTVSFAGCINSGNMTCESVAITVEEKELFDFEAAMGGILGYAGVEASTLIRDNDCGRGNETVLTFEGCENTGTMTPANDLVDYYIDEICGFSAVGTEVR